MVYSNTTVYGGNEYGISGHLHIFTFLKHLILLFEGKKIQGLIFTPVSQTLIACRAMQAQIF